MKKFRLVIIILLFLPAYTIAFDFTKSEGIGTGQTIQFSQPSAADLLHIPSAALSDSSIKIDMGINRSFNLKELDIAFLAFALRKNKFTYSLGFSQLGQRDYYSEQIAKIGFAYHRNSLAVGAYLSYLKLSFGGHYEGVGASSISLGASYKRKRLFYGLLIDDLISSKFEQNSDNIKPKISAYGELVGKGSYSILARITIQENQNAQLGIAQKIKLSPLASLFWGLSNQPAIYGGGFEIYYHKSRISYAASYHPVLGLSHTFTLSYNIGNKINSTNGFK